MATIKLLDGVTSTGVGPTIRAGDPNRRYRDAGRSFQSYITGTGALTATILVRGSNDGVGWILLQTHTLTGTTTDVAGLPSSAQWDFVHAELTEITGTGAAVTVTMGV